MSNEKIIPYLIDKLSYPIGWVEDTLYHRSQFSVFFQVNALQSHPDDMFIETVATYISLAPPNARMAFSGTKCGTVSIIIPIETGS